MKRYTDNRRRADPVRRRVTFGYLPEVDKKSENGRTVLVGPEGTAVQLESAGPRFGASYSGRPSGLGIRSSNVPSISGFVPEAVRKVFELHSWDGRPIMVVERL